MQKIDKINKRISRQINEQKHLKTFQTPYKHKHPINLPPPQKHRPLNKNTALLAIKNKIRNKENKDLNKKHIE